MTEIVLHGRMKERFGGPFDLVVKTPLEAVRALMFLVPGFQQELVKGSYRLVRGDVETGLELDEKMLDFQLGRAPFHIVPVPEGAGGGRGSGVGKIIVGLVIAVAAVFTAGAAAAAFAAAEAGAEAGGIAAAAGAALEGTTVLGVSMSSVLMFGLTTAIGGIAMLLSPNPKNTNSQANVPVAQRASFLFNGTTNVTVQGVPVPLVYGRFRVGSIVVSAGITQEDTAL